MLQAGAGSPPSSGICFGVSQSQAFPRSQAPAWERGNKSELGFGFPKPKNRCALFFALRIDDSHFLFDTFSDIPL